MIKIIKILLIVTSVLSATEVLEKITVEDKLFQPQIKTIEQETQINEQTLDQKLFNSVIVNQTQASTNSKVISIRGNNYRATNYYEDGVELYRTANGYTDLSMYQANSSNIEINSGGAQGTYGPSAIGGDIYINPSKLKSGLHGSFSTTLSTNRVYVDTSLSQKNDDYYFLIDLSGIKQNNFELSHDFTKTAIQNSDSRINSDKEQFNGSIKVGYNLNNNSDIAFKVSHMQGESGNPLQVYLDPSDCGFECTRIDDKELTSYWLYYNYKQDDMKVKFRAYYDDYTDVLKFYSTANLDTLKENPSRYNDTRIGALTSLQYTYDKNHDGTFAIKFDAIRHEQIEIGDPTGDNYGTNESSLSYLHNYNASDKLKLSISTKYKQQDIIKTYDFNTTTVENYKDNRAIDAQFTANYTFNKEHSYYLSVARKTRFASLRELFPFFVWDAEKNVVRPETSDSIEIGTSLRSIPDSVLNISLYYNDIKDMMLYDSAQFSNTVSDSATMKGIEFSLNNFSLDDNEFTLSYAYTEAEDSNNMQIAQVPKSKLFAKEIYSINNNMDFIASYLYSSKRYDLYSGNRYTLGSYSLVDAQISYKANKELSFKAGVKNLFDTLWEYTYGQPSEGRSFFVTLNYNY